jgi:hypothetical protein
VRHAKQDAPKNAVFQQHFPVFFQSPFSLFHALKIFTPTAADLGSTFLVDIP